MTDLLELQKYFILKHLGKDDTAVDFTMGNGHDTSFLSKVVGDKGKIYAFDIQESALESTRETLVNDGCPDNYELICASHDLADNYVKCKIRAGMFNLGYMPGGDHSLTTKRTTTIPAIKKAMEMLDHDSILTVAVYPGHPEGRLEGEEIEDLMSGISRFEYGIGKFCMLNSDESPYFIVIETK